MRNKIVIACLVVFSLFGFLEWGGGNSMFLFQGEWEVLSKLFTDPASVIHPFTMLPMLGQLLLLIALFQKTPRKILVYTGLGLISILLLFVVVVVIISFHYKMILSILPLLVTAAYYIKINWKKAAA